MKLKEHMHSSKEFFSCGVSGCEKVFSTGVAYIYHLNSIHDYKIDGNAKAKRFLAELHSRLDMVPTKRGALSTEYGLFTKKSVPSKGS